MRRFVTLSYCCLAGVACGGGDDRLADSPNASAAASRSVALTGAGATFPYPIYSKWFADYAAATGVKINYQSLGSGAGIRQLSEQTVDFGATDAPMTAAEMAKAKGGPILHFPTVLGAVVATYNLENVAQPLHLTGALLADIFLGKITRWNDARIRAINPGAALPGADIIVVHRSDGSGTTYVFTDYLTSVSAAWRAGPGKGKEVQWPVGLGGKGNEGVAGQVKQTPGALGYVELAYARQNRLAVARVRNANGEWVEPSIASITAAAAGSLSALGDTTDYRVSIVNPPGAGAYPIASFTWLLVYRQQPDATKGHRLVDFMKWMYGPGQAAAEPLDYAPLPGDLAARLTRRLAEIGQGGSGAAP